MAQSTHQIGANLPVDPAGLGALDHLTLQVGVEIQQLFIHLDDALLGQYLLGSLPDNRDNPGRLP